jgi:hypothetical protein
MLMQTGWTPTASPTEWGDASPIGTTLANSGTGIPGVTF